MLSDTYLLTFFLLSLGSHVPLNRLFEVRNVFRTSNKRLRAQKPLWIGFVRDDVEIIALWCTPSTTLPWPSYVGTGLSVTLHGIYYHGSWISKHSSNPTLAKLSVWHSPDCSSCVQWHFFNVTVITANFIISTLVWFVEMIKLLLIFIGVFSINYLIEFYYFLSFRNKCLINLIMLH